MGEEEEEEEDSRMKRIGGGGGLEGYGKWRMMRTGGGRELEEKEEVDVEVEEDKNYVQDH